MYTNSLIWHKMEDIEKETNPRKVQAMCLTMWANCVSESAPEYFGEFMVQAGHILGYPAIPRNLIEGKDMG